LQTGILAQDFVLPLMVAVAEAEANFDLTRMVQASSGWSLLDTYTPNRFESSNSGCPKRRPLLS
jgi:hypothetical protein